MQDRLSLLSSGICKYTYYGKRSEGFKVSVKSVRNLTNTPLLHSLSKSSAKKIKAIITNWYIGIKLTQKQQHTKIKTFDNYLIMITLTLPAKQIESDKIIKSKYLNTFLTKLRYYNADFHYLWVAENQKNGNIHFHLITDKYFKKETIQTLWNDSLANGTYINDFQKKFGHRKPPSTKITGQQGMREPAEYLTKYITKSEKSTPIEGKCWDCSDLLMEISKLIFCWKPYYYDLIECDFYKLEMKYLAREFSELFLFPKKFVNTFINSELFIEIQDEFKYHLSKLFPSLCPPILLKNLQPISLSHTQLQLF
jgi:hypothetical protein